MLCLALQQPSAARPAARPASRRRLVVAAGPQGGPPGGLPLPQAPLPPQQAAAHASAVSGPDEDKEVMHSAFLSAYGTSHHGPRIQGMQEFAGALLARQRIPSGQYSDPLGHIFDEFDRDKSGSLTAAEVAAALRSRNVNITDEQAALFVDAVDLEHHCISRDGFRELIMHMAAADLHSRRSQHAQQGEGDWAMSSWEEQEEIVAKLKGWTDTLLSHRNTGPK